MYNDSVGSGLSLTSSGSCSPGNDSGILAVDSTSPLGAVVEGQSSLQHCDNSTQYGANRQIAQMTSGSLVNSRLKEGFKLPFGSTESELDCRDFDSDESD